MDTNQTAQTESPEELWKKLIFRRLKRALLLRYYTESMVSKSDRVFLDRAIYSTYADCQDAGIAEEAKAEIAQAKAKEGMYDPRPHRVA